MCFDEHEAQVIVVRRCPLTPERGRLERLDYGHKQNSRRNLFVFSQPLKGWRGVELTERRTKSDLAHRMHYLVDECFPGADKVVLVTDNLNARRPALLC